MTAHLPITAPCFVDGMPNDTYHGDCCDSPSLSHGGAHEIIKTCPALYHFDSPYNPDRDGPEDERKFDLGTASHTAVLEPEHWDARVVIVRGRTKDGKESKGYSSQDAKDQRDRAYAAGQTPLLPEEHDKVLAMRSALARHPIAGSAFTGGIAERSFFWRDPDFGVWLKCRPDYLYLPDMDTVLHYKTTGRGAGPVDLAKTNFDMAWYSTVPWYEDGIAAVTGKRPKRSLFVVQETDAPYLVSVVEIHPRAVEWGRRANRKAISIFANCIKTGDWYGYRQPGSLDKDTVFGIDLPGWAHFQFADAMENGAFDVVTGEVR